MHAFLIQGERPTDRHRELLHHFPRAIIHSDNDFVDMDTVRSFRENVLSPTRDHITWYIGGTRWGIESQNALLKICEDVPEGADIIVGASHPSDLVPTLRSRLLAMAPAHTAASAPTTYTLDHVDDYTLAELVNYMRASIARNNDPGALMRAENVLEMIATKRLAERQLKELILLAF